MSIEPTNETKTVAASTISPAGVSSRGGAGIGGGGGGGVEEEEESTLVEISASSSTSSPTTVSSLSPSSRGSSTTTTTGDDAESLHPEAAEPAAPDSSTESSTVALVEEKLPHEQQHQQPPLALVEPSVTVATAEEVQVATGDLPQQQSRNLLPIQSSSSLSTPSSSEEFYDESVTVTAGTSSSEGGALEVPSSNNQVNNNNNTAICSEQQPAQQTSTTQDYQISAESALPSVSLTTASASVAPEISAPDGTAAVATTAPAGDTSVEQRREAPIEIVQIFPSTKATTTTLSSSATSSSSNESSDKSEASVSASTSSSTSSSPSVSPLAVDQQQQQQQPSTVSENVQGTPAHDDKSIVAAPSTDMMGRDQQVPQQRGDLEEEEQRKQQPEGSALMYYNRGSSSSPQLKQSSLKKYKKNNNDERRRVSFPKDAQLITGYLEPIDPWACVTIISTSELVKFYKESCARHSSEPLPAVIEHINALDLTLNQRVSLLSLKDQNLNHGLCEALEEVFKRVQYKCINLSHAGLDDTSASVLFDMIEYYEATNELDFSDNLAMTNKSWLACINMLKKSQALNVLVTRGPGISEHHAGNLAKALNTSALHTLKLEHCELAQRPLATLCNLLKRNTVLKELSLAHNQLTCDDARNIASLLRSNYHIQLLDISNNNIGDKGVEYIVTALIDQSIYFKKVQETKRRSEFSFADLSSSLNSINSNKTYFPNPYGLHQFQQSKQYQHLQQQQNVPKKRHSKKDKSSSTSTAVSPPTIPAVSATTVPLTPPPTPALPNISPSPSAEEVSGPLVQLAAPETAIDALEHEVKSTNNDSGINSSVSSDVDQTNSEHSSSCNRSVEPVVVGSEAEQLIQKDGVSKPEDATQNDSGSCDKECMLDDITEKQTLEFTFDLERGEEEQHVKGPKKARLAKQDSVLSEFESSLPDLSKQQQPQTVNLKLVETPAVKPTEEQPMEEDLPESCTDYDDDANLKIVEENLLVDRSINDATSDSEKNVTKEDPAATTTDNDDSAPVTPLATFKKDELQLLLEKTKQHEQEEIEDPITPTKPVPALPCTEISDANKENNNHLENTSATGKPEKLDTSPLKIVETAPKIQPLSRSLDSTGSSVEFDSPFLGGCQPPAAFPSERSFSSESLNSETSVDSNDSKSSLKYHESKFATRNGTLERQQSSANREAQSQEQSTSTPCGLQVLVLWNNEITRNSAQTFSDLIENTSTLEILNVGCNLLCNDFVSNIKSSLKANSSLTSLGLQGAHLSDNGAKVMAEVIEFGGNSTLQRIDLRNNNILATGLDCLNEALKSNKTVTRIDLDDVPRRVVDNAIDVGPEYSRLLNNIRAQCERNKHPPETSEPISTSIKRVRASHLNSRKISLTCSSIRASPAASTTTAGEKHHHHLLDPSKKTGGRLRSPLPSPIPSPIASPVPSPSRNRFQVTRVGESASGGSTSSLTSIGNNNASTSPSPSSTGSSPTLFFAANSRFRVVTVEEPAPSASSSSSVSNYQQLGRMSSSSISPSPLAAVSAVAISSRMPPTSSSSAPALSSFVVSPKSKPSPIAQQQQQQLQLTTQSQHIPPPLATATTISTPLTPPTPKTTKHTRLPSTSSSTLNDSVISSASIDSPDLEVKRFMAGGTNAGGLLHPATSGSSTGAPRALSSTIDDSYCSSSISSSIDSIDNVLQFNNNTSISSTDESFDLIVSSPSSSSLSVGSVSTAPLVKTVSSPHEDSTLIPRYPEQCSTPVTAKEPTSMQQIIQPVNLLKAKNNSLSSLEMSSQESLYDVQDLSSVSVSSGGGGGSSSLAVLVSGGGGSSKLPPPASGNSNESTLTSIQGLDKDNQKQAGSTIKQTPAEKPPRVRKTSWIASIGNHPASSASSGGGSSGGGSAYPPAVEKLLAIFSPSNLFSSSKSSPPSSECGTVSANVAAAATGGAPPATATGGGKENTTPAANPPPVRKESPMGGLFRWSTKSSSAATATKDEEKVLKVNISPENTITPQTQLIQSQSQHSPQLPVAYNVDNIPSQLKAEIKENISPENTITNKLLVNPPSSSPSPTTVQPAVAGGVAGVTAAAVVPTHPKVIFRLGDDYDESEDDIDTLTSKYGRGSSGGGGSTGISGSVGSLLGTSAGSTTTNSSGISIGSSNAATEGSPTPATMQIPHHSTSGSSLMNTSHLGQLARDSLVTMFKNPSLTSQDSIRSMDSLAEMTAAEQQQQHHHHHPEQQPDTGDAQAQ